MKSLADRGPWVRLPNGLEALALDLVPGQLFRYQAEATPSRRGCLYRFLRCALAYPAAHVVVVYEGLEGPDAGLWFSCSLADFAMKFAPEETSDAH